jgi:phosphohistidine phosphatase
MATHIRLFFMRHSEAVEKEHWKGAERQRPLSVAGERNTVIAAERFASIGLHLDLILSSPLTRALHTAEIMGEAFGKTLVPIADERLAPGFDEDALDDILDEYDGSESILLVGHEPDLGLIAGSLSACARIELKKGALALVDLDTDSGEGRLLWLVPQNLMV